MCFETESGVTRDDHGYSNSDALFLCHVCSAILVTVLYSSVLVRLYRQKYKLNLATEQIRRRAIKKSRLIWMLLSVVIVFYLVWIQKNLVNIILGLKIEVTLPCIYILIINFDITGVKKDLISST